MLRGRYGRIGILTVLLTGCGNGSFVLPDPAYRAEQGSSWILVVDAPRQADLAAPTRQVGRLVASELSLRWFNVVDRDLFLQAHPDVGPSLSRAAHQVLIGEQVDSEVVERLFRRHGVGQLLVVDVFRHEQVWGREMRITRVGVEARLVQLVEGKTLWQARTDPEVSGALAGGFDVAARRAAGELVRLLSGAWPRFEDTPMANWPVLEYFTTN